MRAISRFALVALLLAGCGGDGDDSEGGASRAELPPPDALSTCSRVFYEGTGRPDVLIVSDLPLQGTYAVDGLQGTKAIQIVMEQRGFRAGRHSVGYVSCDGATPRNDISPAKCRRSGRAYADTRDVVGVVGPFFSACAIYMMPVLNRAGLVEVGPGNTYVGLTRPGPGIPADQPERFQPTGRRTFVRLAAPDDLQGRAHAALAQARGDGRVYALHDGVDAYGLGSANAFRDAATEAGIEVAGLEAWDPEAKSYGALVRRVQRSGADSVFLGGYIVSNTGQLIRELRAALGDEVVIMATEAVFPVPALRARAGDAAEGMLVTQSVVANERLDGAGADFLERFRKRTSQNPCCYTVHMAQGAHVLLDAIAASDGSRESVRKAVLDLQVQDGIIGDFSFDENGDVTPPLVSVYRMTDGKQKLFDVVENP
jgi:branched-chain amino acid transport system substrate-binding protein